MPPLPQMGKFLLIIGIGLTLLGLILLFSGKVSWLGRLPGDLYFKGKNISFYFPLATSFLISLILTLILWLIGRK